MQNKKRFKTSILVKMLLGICLPVLAVFVVSFFIILNSVRKPITTMTDDLLTSKSQTASSEVGQYFTRYMEVSKQMAANSEFEMLFKYVTKGQTITKAFGFDGILKTLLNVKATDPDNIVVSWIADFDSSQFTQSDGYVSDSKYDITTRQWYKDVLAAKAPIVTEPYVDTVTKKVIVSAVAPVFDSNTKEILGAACIDFSIDKLQAMMQGYKLGDSGFFMLIAPDGTMIYYPDSNFLEKNISETDMSDNIKNAVMNKQDGEITYTAMGHTVHGYLSIDKNSGYIVVSAMPDKEYLATEQSMSWQMATIYIVVIGIIILLNLLMSLSIIRPIKKLKNAANMIADGKLDVTLSASSRDEVGHVSEAFGRTVERLRGYVDYIDEVSSVLNQIADGNLVFDLKYDYSGEFAKIKTAMLNIQATLSGQVNQMSVVAGQVYGGASQVSQGAQSLAQGASEQAASIEELTATITVISDNIEKNAEEAKSASRIAEKSGAEILRSNEQMEKMIEAMTEIKNTSDKIGSIIGIIDNIAFQTNILALNAAVEAARAGAAGKGFSVVASEVKNLASKSSESAKNTAELINSSLKAIKDGMEIAVRTNSALVGAVESSKETVSLIDHISAVSAEQALSIAQIKSALDQVSSVVQNTSATAEESAAASEELSSQSTILQELVTHFTVEEIGGSSVSYLPSKY